MSTPSEDVDDLVDLWKCEWLVINLKQTDSVS